MEQVHNSPSALPPLVDLLPLSLGLDKLSLSLKGVIAQYTHTLTTTEISPFYIVYSCNISNNKPSSAIVDAHVIYTGYGLSVDISGFCTVQSKTLSLLQSHILIFDVALLLMSSISPSSHSNHHSTLYNGTSLNLMCNYSISPSIGTTLQTAVTWMVDGVAVDTSPGRI